MVKQIEDTKKIVTGFNRFQVDPVQDPLMWVDNPNLKHLMSLFLRSP